MLIEKIKKNLRFFRIPNLMFIIVVISAFVFLIDRVSFIQNRKTFLASFLYFNRELILKGQIWRIFGFVFMPFSRGLMFAALEGYFLYFLGTSLEVSLGEHKFTIFYLTGVLFSILAGFLTGGATVVFLNMTLFFVFATINPNRKVLLFFFLPVNTMLLGFLDVLYFIFNIFLGLIRKDFVTVVAAVVAIVNFLIFFGPNFFIDIFNEIKRLQQNSKRMYKNGNYWNN